MLLAATLLLAQKWKSQVDPSTEEWLIKVRQRCLINKLSAVARVRAGSPIALQKYNEQ